MPRASDRLVPPALGPYVLGDLLGRGGMGAVYRGRDPRLDRDVAIKVMMPGTEPEALHEKRFLREMKAQASLSHPGIVKILDVGIENGFHFFVMDLLEGCTLRALIDREGALVPPRVMSMGISLARALCAMHAQGLVHRDIKPHNIIVTPAGQPVLMDLGLVKVAGATLITEAGAVLGTPRYLAPEILLGGPADVRTDVYQLGLVLYEAAIGSPAFDGPDIVSLARDITMGQLATPPPSHAKLPPAFEDVLRWSFARNRAARAPDATSLLCALEALEAGRRPTLARDPTAVTAHEADDPRDGTDARVGIAVRSGNDLRDANDARGARVSSGPARAGTSPARRLAASGLSSPAAPARPAAVRAIAVAATLALVAGASIAVVSRQGPAAGRTVTGSARTGGESEAGQDRSSQPPGSGLPMPSPLASPGPPGATGSGSPGTGAATLNGGWREVSIYLPRLEAGGAIAHRCVAVLRKTSPVDLGLDPFRWAHWIRLNRWLEDPTGPWPPSAWDAATRVAESQQEIARALVSTLLHNLRSQFSQALIADAFAFAEQAPFDGRVWLLLGRVLEEDHDDRAARSAYRKALECLANRPFEAQSTRVYAGLARALLLKGGPALLEREWGDWIAQEAHPEFAWGGLASAVQMPGAAVDQYRRLLEKAVASNHASSVVYENLADCLSRGVFGTPRDPDRALRLLMEGTHSAPSRDLARALLCFFLSRGDLAQAGERIPRVKYPHGWDAMLRALKGPTFPAPNQLAAPPRDEVFVEWTLAVLFRFREAHIPEAAGALPELCRQAVESPDTQAWIPLDSLANLPAQAATAAPASTASPAGASPVSQAGTAASTAQASPLAFAAQVRDACDKILLAAPLRWTAWWGAAGALASGPGMDAWPQYVERARRQWPDEPLLTLAQALRESRHGDHAQAIATLASIAPDRAAHLPGASVVEVYTRPIWLHAADRRVDVPARSAPAVPDAFAYDAPLHQYWASMRHGALDAAASAAARLQWRDPEEPFWSEVLVWNAARHKDRPAFDDALARARVIIRYHRPGLWPLRELAAVEDAFGRGAGPGDVAGEARGTDR